MSSSKTHVIQGVLSAAVLYPVLQINAIYFGLAVILTDLDKLPEYIMDTRSLDLRGLLVYHDTLTMNLDKNFLGLNLFHTIEFYLLLMITAWTYPVLWYVLTGCLFHHLADQISLIKIGRPFARAFSIFEYLVRRKNKKNITSIQQLLKYKDLKLPGYPGEEKWLSKWRIK